MKNILLALVLLAGCGGLPPMEMPDMGETGDGGAKKAFGDNCSANEECESNICFKGNMRSFCSLKCTAATAAKDCPIPPTTGICNMQGYCKA